MRSPAPIGTNPQFGQISSPTFHSFPQRGHLPKSTVVMLHSSDFAPREVEVSSLGRDVAQLGRALLSGGRGRQFESAHPDHNSNAPPMCFRPLSCKGATWDRLSGGVPLLNNRSECNYQYFVMPANTLSHLLRNAIECKNGWRPIGSPDLC